jgi:hypothetical protein
MPVGGAGTALITSHWWKATGARLPAQTRSVGESTGNGQAVMVEMLIDGIWTDLSSLGLVLSDNAVSIQARGRPGENSVSGPATCSFDVKNFSADFSLSNPMSPYWGKVVLGTRVRISVPRGNGVSRRFVGELSSVPQESDTTGNYSVVAFEAAGILRRLSQGQKPLRSALYREVTKRLTSTVPSGGSFVLHSYWPMEDASTANTLSSAVGQPSMSFTGSPSLASYDGFVCSSSIPNVNGQAFTATVPTYTPMNQGSGSDDGSQISFLLSAPSGIAAGAEICRFRVNISTGSLPSYYDVTVTYTSTDHITLAYASEDGTLTGTSGSIAVTVAGVLQMIELFIHCNHGFASSDTEVLMYRHIVGNDVHDFVTSVDFGPFSSPTVKTVAFNHTKTASDFYIGHLSVVEVPDGVYTINGVGFESLSAYLGELADARFDRLCGEEELTHEVVGTYGTFDSQVSTAEGVAMGYQTADTLLDLLRQCEASDDGIIYEMTSDFGIGYRTRRDLQNQAAVLTLDHSAHELSTPLTPLVDDSFVANDVTVTRNGGASYTDVQTTGPRSISDPPAGMGRYDVSLDFSLGADSQAGDAASWARHKGTVNEARYKAVAVNLGSNELAGTAQRNAILDVVAGDRIVIANVPIKYGPDDISQLAVGFTENIDQFQHTISFNAVPESPYRTGVLGSATKPRAGTTDSRTVGGTDTTGTSITVKSVTGAVWVDSATYASDFPFDIRINGEQMTVTAITGTTSPQVFTVTRSVNGVVKGHNDNSSVTLDVPAYVGM